MGFDRAGRPMCRRATAVAAGDPGQLAAARQDPAVPPRRRHVGGSDGRSTSGRGAAASQGRAPARRSGSPAGSAIRSAPVGVPATLSYPSGRPGRSTLSSAAPPAVVGPLLPAAVGRPGARRGGRAGRAPPEPPAAPAARLSPRPGRHPGPSPMQSALSPALSPMEGSSGTTATASNARNRRSPAHRQAAFSLPDFRLGGWAPSGQAPLPPAHLHASGSNVGRSGWRAGCTTTRSGTATSTARR